MTRVAGVDGTKGGWVAVVLENGRLADDRLLPLETRFEELGDCSVVTVDVPIGFGPREADRAAREYLRPHTSVVFTTPPRDVLERPFGPGLGVSAQAHALGRRVIHVTDLAARNERIYEVHPEVSFRAMNGGRPLDYRKKWAGGALQRIELLRRHGIDLTRIRDAAAVALDDVLDAAAAAWSALRIADGSGRTLPDSPAIVEGRRVAIWY